MALASIVDCVLIFTQSARLLLNCAVGSYAQHPAFDPIPLCQLLSTMQALAGHQQLGCTELHGRSIQLLEGYSVIVAVVCARAQRSHKAARLLGMQVLNAFGKLFHRELHTLLEEHEVAMDAAVTTYTFHSATSGRASEGSGHMMIAGGGAATLPSFVPFQQSFLLPLLLGPPAGERFLQPLMALPAAVRAMLLRPASSCAAPPLASEATDDVLLATAPRAGTFAHYAGPHLPQLWSTVQSQAQRVVQLLSTAAASTAEDAAADVHSPLAVLRFPGLRGAHGAYLHAALRAVRVIPGGACLVLFYSAAGDADGDQGWPAPSSTETARPPATSLPVLDELVSGETAAVAELIRGAPETLAPPEVRTALDAASRSLATSFPAAVTSLADAIASLRDADPPTTPARASASDSQTVPLGAIPASECTGTMSPLQLDIVTPRAAYHDPIAASDDAIAAKCHVTQLVD